MVSRPPSFEEVLKRPVGEYGKGTIEQRVNLAALRKDKDQLADLILRLARALARTTSRYRKLECATLDETDVASGLFVDWASAVKSGQGAIASAVLSKLERRAVSVRPDARAMSGRRRHTWIASRLAHAFIALRMVTHAQS